MSPNRQPASARARARAAFLLGLPLVLAGCGTISRTPPAPTPADFPGIAGLLTNGGIAVTNIVSGDAGCADPTIAKTAIGFDAVGADQPTPVRIHIYIFRNKETYVRERASVDTCAAAFVTDPSTYEVEESSPFVLAGQGPWAPSFRKALRDTLVAAAGDGG